MTATIPQNPAHEAMLQQALLHYQAKRWEAAETLYREIMRADPCHADTINELGRTLLKQGRLEEASQLFQRLIALKPNLALPYRNLGITLCGMGKLEESFASFRRHAELSYGQSKTPATQDNPIPAHKDLHDQEQSDYLTNLGTAPLNHAFHIEGGARVVGRAVNPDVAPDDIAAAWQNKRPRIVVIDNFLSDEALDGLRRFCLGSTIWRLTYTAGYLGAMPEHGMGSPLLAQITDELRATYPAILRAHPLQQFWGFKYDSRQSGIAIHADFAAVNVNFWITPDDANLDPASGGMIIWDQPTPQDWDFAAYNDDETLARRFLLKSGARPVTVPYRSNRVVIFDSSLFHETDRLAFKPGYENRRINITLLYGRREATG